ncbi:NAD(P) transhydrogenase subunit beta [Glaciecola punicea ACAM 611]|jgi:NAD(P) transhydrogenase subunit beta|uniref:NAD(P) transhydrogenase subunit beta n=1 Tax=Glaciecola punicea ACAM 611 TaxID=1121923 RepID=H5TCZ3_9ALTE|nr:NAD(P)(+) transhydrogenase (Re/Si-specific) subunit beta [Glaciecola punicea]OFA30405.1 NAD synthetase [Glaciecola punicea]GAB56170.1 NAD(P) transhydrogenase subunit beta [Glaciecola punicea ACAM 611]
MQNEFIINVVYLISAALFIIGLKLLSHPSTARRGNLLSAVGMLVAICITLIDQQIVSYQWILIALAAGSIVGAVVARKIALTSMPELVSLLNGIGGLASLAVAFAMVVGGSLATYIVVILLIAIAIGGVTFTGSLVAWAKLSGKLGNIIQTKAMVFKGQAIANSLLVLAIVLFAVGISFVPQMTFLVFVFVILCLALGVMLVLPIGGADMPVVISLLNSYSGLAACAAGIALNNNLLIVAGALVGASGIILTSIMCKAMNRSLTNVLFSGFKEVSSVSTKIEGEVKAISCEDAYYVLEAAQSVIVIPGYGMAVAQAQHAMKELQSLLEGNGAEVVYGIHPVAGRMPGHMNVLLAEADVPYELLLEMDEVNPRMENYDVAIVIGANDVVNPAAREIKESPIYGMPVINADLAKNVFIMKRGMASGFAGIDNPLFFKDNASMIFGDAKDSINAIIRQFAD